MLERRKVIRLELDVSSVAAVPATTGVLIDPDGRFALLHRGAGAQVKLTAEGAADLVRSLLTILPELEDREAGTREAVAAGLASLSEERH